MITYEELMKEVERLKISDKNQPLTEEQIKFIDECRKSPNPLSWYAIERLWKKMPDWQPLGRTSINTKYSEAKDKLTHTE